MVTKKEIKQGWTNIRIRTETLTRLKILKAQLNARMFDDIIVQSLNSLKKEESKNENN